uniref:Uncharacterized protein n=1 Tax=Rhizophagus irregularis (strain DAOM 181602 / DAOM 197198 / MUCL 43194) TaxID=747089 RepID=U9SXC1_RHIID
MVYIPAFWIQLVSAPFTLDWYRHPSLWIGKYRHPSLWIGIGETLHVSAKPFHIGETLHFGSVSARSFQ